LVGGWVDKKNSKLIKAIEVFFDVKQVKCTKTQG
jgi:hypothetical protein